MPNVHNGGTRFSVGTLVSQRLALRDIFTAGGLTRRIFVAVVHVSVTVQPTESDEAELSTRCSPSARRQAA